MVSLALVAQHLEGLFWLLQEQFESCTQKLPCLFNCILWGWAVEQPVLWFTSKVVDLTTLIWPL